MTAQDETLLNIETEVNNILDRLNLNERLSEMEDYMNQNEFSVSITTEETTLHAGVVNFTANVKNKNGQNIPNKIVEFYQDNQLLGYSTTNANGNASYYERIPEGAIFDLAAIVKGTHSGDSKRFFVKRADNRFSDAVWSGGDTSAPVLNEDYTKNSSVSLSRGFEWASQGRYSFKISTAQPSNSAWVKFIIPLQEGDIGKKFTFKAKIRVPNGSCKVIALLDDITVETVSIPPEEDENAEFSQLVIHDKEITEGHTNLVLHVRLDDTYYIYMDDLGAFIG